MYSTAIKTKRGAVTIRPLRNGDTRTVQAVFDRLGEQSRRLRFGLARANLNAAELELLARVDSRRHVLVAFAGGSPVAMAHLARDDDRTSAEIAWAVADDWQRLGIGSALARSLAAEAAAAGISRVHGYMHPDNRGSLALMRRATAIVSSRVDGDELHVVGRIGAGCTPSSRRPSWRAIRIRRALRA